MYFVGCISEFFNEKSTFKFGSDGWLSMGKVLMMVVIGVDGEDNLDLCRGSTFEIVHGIFDVRMYTDGLLKHLVNLSGSFCRQRDDCC